MRVEHLAGAARLAATTAMLQRTRLADPTVGIWEAADLQWWWRRPRSTDDIALPVWFDDEGPAAVVTLTDWDRTVQADALAVPGAVALDEVWAALLEAIAGLDAPSIEVLARDDDHELLALLAGAGFVRTDESSGSTWMAATDRPPVADVAPGYRIIDRASAGHGPHPMRVRNGEEVEARLRTCSLYDPALDLAVETDAGEAAGYALYWFDPVTGVGMLEPMRVEDAHQRRGLARALLTEGLERLATAGATRLKVGFDGEAGRNLYLGAGFRLDSMATAHRR